MKAALRSFACVFDLHKQWQILYAAYNSGIKQQFPQASIASLATPLSQIKGEKQLVRQHVPKLPDFYHNFTFSTHNATKASCLPHMVYLQ